MGIVSRSQGGGFTPVTAKVRLAAAAVGQTTGAQLLFDTVVYDAAGYFHAAGNGLLVPAGKAGKHLFVLKFLSANVPAAANPVGAFLLWSGAEANVGLNAGRKPAGASAECSVASIVNANVGDEMTSLATWEGGGVLDYSGGVNGCYMAVTYLGTG